MDFCVVQLFLNLQININASFCGSKNLIPTSHNCQSVTAEGFLTGVVKLVQKFSEGSLCVSRNYKWRTEEHFSTSITYI